MSRRWKLLMLACSCAAFGCEQERAPTQHAPLASAGTGVIDTVAEAPPPVPTRPALCDRPGADVVRDLFCADAPADIRSLAELRTGLQLTFKTERALDAGTPASDAAATAGAYPSNGSDPYVVLLAHSTALSGNLVSQLNPRALIMNFSTFVAFNRGVQQVEVATRDRDQSRFNLYLLSFEQACNTSRAGCTPGDLYTPNIEADWTRVSVQDDEELKNTASDCRQCHQRARDKPMLLMRELQGPWTHFFGPDNDPQSTPSVFPEPTGADLRHDYENAKGDELYAGIPAYVARGSVGFTLESLVSAAQPVVFDGSQIMNERWPWDNGYGTTPVRSVTWDSAYQAFKNGEQLALPYYAPSATDPDKMAQLSAAYQRYQQQDLAANELPDLADIFPDDPQTRAEIGLQVEPGATPAQLLVQACGSCHNDVLDQTLSRARFSVAVGRLDRSELDLAITRLKLPRASAATMPPRGRRQLDAESLGRLLDYLQAVERSEDDDAFLEHAAQRGMVPTDLPHADPYPPP